MMSLFKRIKALPHKSVAIALLIAVFIALVFQYRSSPPTVESPPSRETATWIQEDDPEMRAAFARAQQTLDGFLDLKQSPPPKTRNYSVKIGIANDGQTEYFWIFPFSEQPAADASRRFIGVINEEPKRISNVRKGQQVQFSRAEIVDWTYDNTDTRTMHGNFTGCVTLAREAPEHAAQFQELYGLQCGDWLVE